MRVSAIWSRFLLLILALCLVLTVLAGCSSEEEAIVRTTESTEKNDDFDDGLHDENGYLLDQLPDDLNYNGEGKYLGNVFQRIVDQFLALE